MAQGKLKAKAQLPKNVKSKKSGPRKGTAVTKRANRPIQPKKKGLIEAKKIKQAISKTVNKAVEDEIRQRATNENKPSSLSKAQQAVVEYHKKSAT